MFIVKIQKNVVVNVTVGDDADWCANVFGGTWVATEQHVGVGWTYNDQDGFRPLQPYPSWTWQDGAWRAPLPYPEGAEMYGWDEQSGAWVGADEDDV